MSLKLTKKVEYAIAGLHYLAWVAPGRLVQVREIAEAADVSRRFLEQIFLALREAGLLHSRRGAQGGYRLARAASAISLADLCAALDELTPAPSPELRGIAADYTVWRAQQAIWDALSAITLEDLADDALRRHLREASRPPTMYYI